MGADCSNGAIRRCGTSTPSKVTGADRSGRRSTSPGGTRSATRRTGIVVDRIELEDAQTADFQFAADCGGRGWRAARPVCAGQQHLIVGDETRSRPQNAWAGRARQRNARSDLPDPDGPRMSTAASARAMQVAWMLSGAAATGSASACAGAMGRHADGEARALARLAGAVFPAQVLGKDFAAVRAHDLARDRQAKAGVLAAQRFCRRPVGVEAVEDDLEPVGGNARAFVFDRDLDGRPSWRARTMTTPASGENEMALSIRLVTTWPRRLSLP